MTTVKFQTKLYQETGRFFKVQQLYYLERIGVFSVPRTSTGRRDFSSVYREVYEKIMEYYSKRYGWLNGTMKGEVTNED